MTFYLRIEAVNLGRFVYDTAQLSVVRGGGLLLLKAITEAEITKAVAGRTPIEKVMTGASSGVFSFEADDEESAGAIRQTVEDHFRNDERFRHATFVSSLVAKSGEAAAFQRDRDALIARNRFRQMRACNVAIPEWRKAVEADSDEAADPGPCAVDRLRPAVETLMVSGEKKRVSAATKLRARYGQEAKQHFYQALVGIEPPHGFCFDFADLTRWDNPDRPAPAPATAGKLALLYVDGNGFGDLQKAHCRTAEAQKHFSEDLKAKQAGLLRSLLEEVVTREENDSSWISPERRYRFETLLWGGDEMMWVMPAWKGSAEVAAFFYEQTAGWDFEETPLRHGAGLVFAGHKAPIHRLKDLARDLADGFAKQDRSRNLLAYEVLESFDHIGRDLDSYRREQSPGGDPSHLLLEGAQLPAIGRAVRDLKNDPDFSRGKLHRVCSRLLRPRTPSMVATIEGWLEAFPSADRLREAAAQIQDDRPLRELTRDAAELMDARAFAEHGGPESLGLCAAALHVNQLWDYLD